MDNSAGTITGTNVIQASYPIVLKCDEFAVPLVLQSSLGQFWQAPYFVANTNDDVGDLSISGKHGDDKLFLSFTPITLNSVTIQDIYTKQLDATYTNDAHTSYTLKTIYDLFDGLPVRSDSPVKLKLFDLGGNVLMEVHGNMKEITADFKRNLVNLPASIYLARFISGDGTIINSQKIFIGN